MQTHNTTIPPADKGALLDAACTFGTASSDSSFAFITMCELSTLVHKLQRTCCTLGSMNRSTGAREDDVTELFKSSEGLLGRWRPHLAGTAERATGVGESGPLQSASVLTGRVDVRASFGVPLHAHAHQSRAQARPLVPVRPRLVKLQALSRPSRLCSAAQSQ